MYDQRAVLWVEDDVFFFESMAKTLARHTSLALHHVRTKHAAHDAMSTRRIDRLVVDLCLGPYGDLSGLEFLEEIRVRGDQTPAIVMSGNLEPAIAYRVKSAGATDFPKGTIESPAWLARVIELGGVEPVLAGPGLARANPFERVADEFERLPGFYVENRDRVEEVVLRRARDSERSLNDGAKKLGMLRQTFIAKLQKLGLKGG